MNQPATRPVRRASHISPEHKMSLTAADFRIETIKPAVLNGRQVVTFMAYRTADNEFCGQFSAPARTAKRDLWQIAAGNDFIKPPGRPAKLDDARAVNVTLDAPGRAKAARIGSGNVSEGLRIALAAYSA